MVTRHAREPDREGNTEGGDSAVGKRIQRLGTIS